MGPVWWAYKWCSNITIDTLALDGWIVMYDTENRGLGGLASTNGTYVGALKHVFVGGNIDKIMLLFITQWEL